MAQYLLAIFLIVSQSCSTQGGYEPDSGDIVFQTSHSGQSRAIQIATNSPYSHMGIVYLRNGTAWVYEAVQPVKLTPLQEWVKRGESGHFVAKRLKNASSILSSETLQKMQEIGEPYLGLGYDLYFEWSDERIYCSELVWKIYKQGAGIEIGNLATLADFELTHPEVQKKLAERYGRNVPLGEMVISPAAMFESNRLETVYQNPDRP